MWWRCRMEIRWKIGDVPCGHKVRVEGVFTGDVPSVEHSVHWSRQSLWFSGKKVIIGRVYVQDKYTVSGPVYRKGGDLRSILPFHSVGNVNVDLDITRKEEGWAATRRTNECKGTRRILCTQAIEEDKDGMKLHSEHAVKHGFKKHEKDRGSKNLCKGNMLGLGFSAINVRNRMGGTLNGHRARRNVSNRSVQKNGGAWADSEVKGMHSRGTTHEAMA
ncbi:hypothetical protein DFH08DRAFT_823243 [Mycena albidolilacea]|uniref:Uncharacterized protein n=1 Tax=Mycena albidolilacea TaxID=1033008 RepID=A0AAD7EBD9_9AGAR|nr:hypothetical protein DFH08DRAFT_823243 [Mycena albidolilacea]